MSQRKWLVLGQNVAPLVHWVGQRKLSSAPGPLKFWISAEFFDFQANRSPGLRGPIERALEGGLGLAQMWRPLCSEGTRGRRSCTSHIDFLELDSAFGL